MYRENPTEKKNGVQMYKKNPIEKKKRGGKNL